jgi:hypothetical protein
VVGVSVGVGVKVGVGVSMGVGVFVGVGVSVGISVAVAVAVGVGVAASIPRPATPMFVTKVSLLVKSESMAVFCPAESGAKIISTAQLWPGLRICWLQASFWRPK